MEDWTKYVLDNVNNEDLLHYCAKQIRANQTMVLKALAEDKNQLAAELVAETCQYVDLLSALDNRVNGEKKTTVVA